LIGMTAAVACDTPIYSVTAVLWLILAKLYAGIPNENYNKE